jgi:hypothetical protein
LTTVAAIFTPYYPNQIGCTAPWWSSEWLDDYLGEREFDLLSGTEVLSMRIHAHFRAAAKRANAGTGVVRDLGTVFTSTREMPFIEDSIWDVSDVSEWEDRFEF